MGLIECLLEAKFYPVLYLTCETTSIQKFSVLGIWGSISPIFPYLGLKSRFLAELGLKLTSGSVECFLDANFYPRTTETNFVALFFYLGILGLDFPL